MHSAFAPDHVKILYDLTELYAASTDASVSAGKKKIPTSAI